MECNMNTPFHESETISLNWRKSARSVNNGNCTEVASTDGIVVVRDSTDQAGTHITYSAATWRNFGQSVRQGRFDIQH